MKKLLCIAALVVVTGFVLIACDIDTSEESPVPKELWGTWDDSGNGKNGNDFVTTLIIREHEIEYDANGTHTKNPARSARGKKIEEYALLKWTTFCESYEIQGDQVTLVGYGTLGDDWKFTRKPADESAGGFILEWGDSGHIEWDDDDFFKWEEEE